MDGAFDWLKSFPPSVNNLFRGIPFSHEDKIKINEHSRVIVARKKNKGKTCLVFSLVLQVFERVFLQKISHFDRQGWIALIFRDQGFFKRRPFFIDSPVTNTESHSIPSIFACIVMNSKDTGKFHNFENIL